MTVKFQDQRVVNFLERPKSNDFNAAQSMARNNLATALHAIYTGGALWSSSIGSYSGFDGPFAMRVRAAGSGMANKAIMEPGMAIATVPSTEDVGGIQGVSNYSTRQLIVNTGYREITVPAAPGANLCRRDVIAVKPIGYLAEQELTDIFNPLPRSFGAPQLKPKAYRWDLSTDDVVQETLPAADYASATSPLLYLVGQTVPYAIADDLLSAPIPTLPPYYRQVAVINRVGTNDIVANNNIADWRIVRAVGGGPWRFQIEATLGSYQDAPGYAGFVEKYSTGPGGYNAPRYLLRNYAAALTTEQRFSVMVFGGMTSAPEMLITGSPNADQTQEANVQVLPLTIKWSRWEVDTAFLTELQSTEVTPYGAAVSEWLAIGQPYVRKDFCLSTLQPDGLTGVIKPNVQAVNFATTSIPIIRPSVILDVDWYISTTI